MNRRRIEELVDTWYILVLGVLVVAVLIAVDVQERRECRASGGMPWLGECFSRALFVR